MIPPWYLDLVGAEQVEFQIVTRACRGSWHEPEGAERDKVWQFFTDCHPFYVSYQASTDRIIPLVMMKALEAIPVFQEMDATGIRQS
ncbi:MAG TPA: nitroreductase/quinone reductase family protein [Sphingobium sp.]